MNFYIFVERENFQKMQVHLYGHLFDKRKSLFEQVDGCWWRSIPPRTVFHLDVIQHERSPKQEGTENLQGKCVRVHEAFNTPEHILECPLLLVRYAILENDGEHIIHIDGMLSCDVILQSSVRSISLLSGFGDSKSVTLPPIKLSEHYRLLVFYFLPRESFVERSKPPWPVSRGQKLLFGNQEFSMNFVIGL